MARDAREVLGDDPKRSQLPHAGRQFVQRAVHVHHPEIDSTADKLHQRWGQPAHEDVGHHQRNAAFHGLPLSLMSQIHKKNPHNAVSLRTAGSIVGASSKLMSEYFPVPPIAYEGPDSRNPLAFKFYNPDARIEGRSMRDHLRFAAAYWHCMRNPLADPFGAGTAITPWDDGSDSTENALRRVDVFFEFLQKISIDLYCFHDRDVSPERDTIPETERVFDQVADRLQQRQEETGVKLLWGTACLFTHPRYAQGAATSPELGVFLHAAAQVKKAIEITHRLGGQGYTFWGGREGYNTLVNTSLQREREHLAALLHMAVAFKQEIGFAGQFYIEPKPQEPTTHQYDSDSAACLNFLREFGLLEHFKLNLETNHATLAGHTMAHEMRIAVKRERSGPSTPTRVRRIAAGIPMSSRPIFT